MKNLQVYGAGTYYCCSLVRGQAIKCLGPDEYSTEVPTFSPNNKLPCSVLLYKFPWPPVYYVSSAGNAMADVHKFLAQLKKKKGKFCALTSDTRIFWSILKDFHVLNS